MQTERIHLTQIKDAQIEVNGSPLSITLASVTCTRTISSIYNSVLREHSGGHSSAYEVDLEWTSPRSRDLAFEVFGAFPKTQR